MVSAQWVFDNVFLEFLPVKLILYNFHIYMASIQSEKLCFYSSFFPLLLMFLQMSFHSNGFEFVEFDTAYDGSDIKVQICISSLSHEYETTVQ